MTTGRPEQTLEWMRDGTARLLAELGKLPDDDLAAPSLLPGWDRRYLLSHVAANADALRNLVHWARTGEERRMYASVEARDAGIKAGAAKPASELRAWIGSSAASLEIDLDGLSGTDWDARIITAQGLTREAREIPWMRVREVYIHAVDLGGGTGFADLPAGFLITLLDDIAKRRSSGGKTPALAVTASDADGRSWEVTGPGERTAVTAPLAGIAAWLSGRPVAGLTTADGQPVPDLPAWL
ncbi:MAG: maleylpyruvate isomerase family mycothiol-dependent enzyme [Streptosporangiales bacterium]|nr:maleylpyruvate isomerase family mycothiol-dependent enzyme [Streptosporangiales bacterium]